MAWLAHDRVIARYLERYAEVEASEAVLAPGSYAHVAVVPSCREGTELRDVLQPLDQAANAVGGRALTILVVNGRECASDQTHASNRETCEFVLASGDTRPAGPGMTRVESAHSDILLVDRSSEGRRLPAKQGVGLARKIGCDIALAGIARGAIESPWIHTTDADAIVPSSYFTPAAQRADRDGASALALPFVHHFPANSEFGTAAALYELSLRYFVLGLRHAGSPYAFQTIGSTMAMHALSYAQVRGFPRKEAGEDFYLLNKLAKVGAIRSIRGAPIELKARPSDRVPFGTGVGVTRIEQARADGTEYHLYHPDTFPLLRCLLLAFAEHSEAPSADRTLERLQETAWGEEGVAVLKQARIPELLEDAARNTRAPAACLKRIHTGFDAFRTRKLVHAIRDVLRPPIPWREALTSAAFLPDAMFPGELLPSEACDVLSDLEATGVMEFPDPLRGR